MPDTRIPAETAFHYLTSDAKVIGIVTWVGFVFTLLGLLIAYFQLKKIRRSSEAASAAVSGLARMVRSHEQSSKVADAYSYLLAAQAMITQSNLAAAAVNLQVSWKALIAARTLTERGPAHERLSEFVVAVHRLLDDVSMPGIAYPLPPEFLTAKHVEISRAVSDVGTLSTTMQTHLSGIGIA